MPDKYSLYEQSVQSPETDLELLENIYKDAFKKNPTSLREDFCGTFFFACEWVKRGDKNSALCLDLDPVPLEYGKKKHLKKLRLNQKKRIRVLQKNVVSKTLPKSDIVAAFNFSFFIFKKRVDLVNYLKNVRESLKTEGVVVFEIAGGPGMIQKMKEKKTVYSNSGNPKFTYIWDQKKFNPITHEGLYSINFKMKNGTYYKDAFVYDWRVWTVPEICDAMIDAGFDETAVYWEAPQKKSRTTEFLKTEIADNDWSWIAYIAGIKRN